jgi:HSP20 family protein
MTMMTRYEPFTNVLSLRDAVNQLLEESFVAPFARTMQATNIMPVDVYETEDAFVVKAFMPGLTPDQLNVSIEQNTVIIHGEPGSFEHQDLRPIVRETNIGAFTRQFTLPVPIDADKVNAELVNGVLTLRLPKVASAKPRKIRINASSS